MRCSRCVMDTTAEEIVFTEDGCNFCEQALVSLAEVREDKPNLKKVVKMISDSRRIELNQDYDCLIGLSGGVDSSYLLMKAVEFGLKPLAFSVDNGWQTDNAQENVMKLVEGLKVPYHRYRIDPKKFDELQAAFIKAGQKNIEIPTDHILMAVTFEMAKLYDIKYILSGGNVATESIMPPSWGYNARDLIHIKDVYRKMTGRRLSGLPTCSLLKWNYYRWISGIKTVYLLDYLDYDRNLAEKELGERVGYVSYGEKHTESVYTHWFQNFYLYEKFGIDKRKAHLSSLIISGQITREQALDILGTNPVYPQLGIEKKTFRYVVRPYTDFRTDERLYNGIRKLVNYANLK